MKVSVIAAVANNLVIGRNNDLAWHLPDDMQFFKETTTGHHVIMGRKNYEAIPHKYRPLPGRTNIIVTRNQSYDAEGCVVVNTIGEAIEYAQAAGEEEAFIIGGGEIYNQTIELADCMYITKVEAEVEGDTYFPEFNESSWSTRKLSSHAADERHEYAFTIWQYDKITNE